MPSFQQPSKRKRGVLLSPASWRRRQEAQERSEIEANGGDHTQEQLNQLTGLSPHALTKLRDHKAPVDKRSLEDDFSAFKLTLTPTDYTRPTQQPIIPLQQD